MMSWIFWVDFPLCQGDGHELGWVKQETHYSDPPDPAVTRPAARRPPDNQARRRRKAVFYPIDPLTVNLSTITKNLTKLPAPLETFGWPGSFIVHLGSVLAGEDPAARSWDVLA